MIAKTCSRSRVKKGPWRSKAHRMWVADNRCLVCWLYPTHAHHCRSVAPRTMGKRVSDAFCVPLCPECHAELHTMNEAAFWQKHGIDPIDFISFSAEGAAEITRLNPSEGTGT